MSGSGGQGGAKRIVARLLIPVGVLLTAAGAVLPWWRQDFADGLTGARQVTLTGASVFGGLVPLAVVVLAGWAAAGLTDGIARRIVGSLVTLAALGLLVGAVVSLGQPDPALFTASLTRPAAASGGPERALLGAAAAVTGACLLVAGGLLILVRDRVRRGAGRGGYDVHQAPSARRDAARREADQKIGEPAAGPADPEELWRALDVGVDLTGADTSGEPGADTGADTGAEPGVVREDPGAGGRATDGTPIP